MAHETTQLILGRGEVYFDRFLPGTQVGEGEVYIGNSLRFQVEREIERLDRKQSYRGRLHDREGALISESHTVSFTTDNIRMSNLALWYGTEVVSELSSESTISQTLTVKRGRYYQLTDGGNVFGSRNVSNVVLLNGSTPILSPSNWSVDEATGRIHIFPTAVSVPEGVPLTARFVERAGRGGTLASKAEEVHGALRFISRNEGASSGTTSSRKCGWHLAAQWTSRATSFSRWASTRW